MIKQKFIITHGVQLVSLVLGLGSSIVVTRIGGPDVVGTLAFGMAFVAVFQFVSDLGISTAQLKLINSTDEVSDYIATFMVLKLFTSLLFLTVIVIYYYLQVKLFHNPSLNTSEIRTVILIYIAIYFLDSLNYIYRTNFIARTERAKVEIPTFFQATSDKISRIALISLGFGAVALATSSLLFCILVLPVNIYLFRNYKVGRFRKELIKSYISISIPVIIITFSELWADNIDRILLRELHGTYELGVYMAAFSLSAPVKLLGSSMSSILFPSFSSLIHQNNFSEISKMIVKYRNYLTCIFLPFIILVIIFSSKIVIFLFGEKYYATVTYFPFIITTLFIYIYTLPYLNLVYANNMFNRIALISIIVLIFEIGLIYILSSKTGYNLKGLGAAIALLITNIVLYFIYDKLAQKIVKIILDKRVYLMMMVQIVLGVLVSVIIKLNFFSLYFIMPILYLVIIFFIEWKMKIITKEDIKFIISFADIKPLLEYVRAELNNKKLP